MSLFVHRFHSFGLGQEVCPELIFGIAAATGGSSVIVQRGERLQAHVSIKEEEGIT